MQPAVNAPRDLLDVVPFLQQIAGKNERVGLLQSKLELVGETDQIVCVFQVCLIVLRQGFILPCGI